MKSQVVGSLDSVVSRGVSLMVVIDTLTECSVFLQVCNTFDDGATSLSSVQKVEIN
jgi:hypothetical protein